MGTSMVSHLIDAKFQRQIIFALAAVILGLFGNAAKDKDYVLEAVDEVMDKFLLDYRDSNLN